TGAIDEGTNESPRLRILICLRRSTFTPANLRRMRPGPCHVSAFDAPVPVRASCLQEGLNCRSVLATACQTRHVHARTEANMGIHRMERTQRLAACQGMEANKDRRSLRPEPHGVLRGDALPSQKVPVASGTCFWRLARSGRRSPSVTPRHTPGSTIP